MAPKKKQEKMSLGTFLQDENYGSWADEMEDMPLISSDSRPSYGADRRPAQSGGFGSGMGNGFSERRDNFIPREQLPLPTQPPYTAHLANLSFDATNVDIEQFFQECSVTNVRIVEDKLDRKPKGFGYVEFATQDGLKTALTLSGSSLAGRQVRISVAEPPKERQDASRDLSDWSRKGPLPDLPSSQRRVSDRPPFGGRNFDNLSDAGSDRGGRPGGFEPSDGKVRDFSNWERKGPLPPAAGPALSLRDGGRQGSKDSPAFRRNSPAWGEGHSQDGSRPPRREYSEKPVVERQPTAPELDNEWRARMKPDRPVVQSPTPETSNPPSPKPPAAPASRPKLNLAKRTVSEAVPEAAPSPASAADSKASPFGAARPVDTAAKEREIEEKRLLALRQKKEADEKEKAQRSEEKKATKDKADQQDKTQSSSPRHPKERSASNKENGEEQTQQQAQQPKFDILRRVDPATNDMVANDDDTEETAAPAEKDDKTKDSAAADTTAQSNGSWRNGPAAKKPATAAAATTPVTVDPADEDGWSTVAKPNKQRNNRRHNPSRPVAS